MAKGDSIKKSITGEGEVYEGGGEQMFIKSPGKSQSLSDFVNNNLYQFNNKKVRVTVKIEIEEL